MATTTPNFGWPVPTSTDYVKDGATAIEALGDAIDTTVAGLGASGLTLISAPTVTAQSTWQINNIFTSTYTNYVVLYRISITNATNCWAQFSTSGTPYSGTQYYWRSTEFSTATTYNTNGGIVNKMEVTFQASGGAEVLSGVWQIQNPQVAATTYLQGLANRPASANNITGGSVNVSNQFDGLYFYVGAGTMTGQLWVYGYDKA